MAFNILDILKNEYNNFYNKADVLMWNIDGKKYTSEEFNKLNFRANKVKESFYVEIAPNSAINMTGHSSFEYSFKVGVRKVEYQGVERWVQDGYFLLLDNDWDTFFLNNEYYGARTEALNYSMDNYKPSKETIYFSLFRNNNLWYINEFQMVKSDLGSPCKTIEEALTSLPFSFNEAMTVVFSIYESRRFMMDYYQKIEKYK